MVFDTTCSRLRLGGSISGSVLTGGTIIDAAGIAITSQSGLFQFPGFRGLNPQLLGSDGAFHRTGKAVRPKVITLNFRAYGRDATGIVTTTKREHLEANLDSIFSLIAGAGERAILERDMADGTTRWIYIQVLNPASYIRAPFFNSEMGAYDLPVIATAHYPFWQSEVQTTTVIPAGAGTIVNAGNARISNMSLAFAAAGSITNDPDGDVVTATAAVTVDVGEKTISNGGAPTPGRVSPFNREHWFRTGAGSVAVTVATTTVTAIYRSHWH